MSIPACHLAPAKGLRAVTGFRAFPLGERPPATARPAWERYLDCVAWLDVERSARYQPAAEATYCNIYAHDLCHLMGAYLPRMWWMADELAAIQAGAAPRVIYGRTVREMNANALHDWMRAHGQAFGWRIEPDLSELQSAANSGRATVIIARRRHPARSGHVTCVIPETPATAAVRDAAGAVTIPVQSQAGSRNRARFASEKGRWWATDEYSAFVAATWTG